MKKFVNSLVFASLILIPVRASAQYGAIEHTLANTDPALSAAFFKAQAAMPVFSVPTPANIAPGRAAGTPAAEYLPLSRKAIIEYEYTSSEFAAPKAIRLEFLEYSEANQTARVSMIIFSRAKPVVANFVLSANSAGLRSAGHPLYGSRLEIPYPLTYNASWNEGGNSSRVAALNAIVTVPAGTFNGCLKITTRLSDAGTAERYYAPGVGLVYETIVSGGRQETIRLTSYQLKYAGMN